MNRKQFIILLVLVIVLGAWGYKRWSGKSSSWSGGSAAIGKKLLGDFAVNDVAQISIKHGTQEVLLAKQNDLWRVAQRSDYPANFPEISSLLLKLKDLKIVQTEQVGPSQLPRLELTAGGTNAPTVVEFRDANGKALKTLTLGKNHTKAGRSGSPMDELGGEGWPDGRYVLVGSTSDNVALISDPLTDVTPDASHWLNKDFFKVEKTMSIAVTFPEATNSWTLSRTNETSEWKLADAKADEKIDSGKISGVTSPFSSPSLNDVVIGLTPEQTGLDKSTTIKVGTFDGFEYTVNVGNKTNDNYLIAVSVAGNFPKERAAVADEKPDAKAKLDKEFADSRKKLEEKLATESAFNKWIYEVSSWTVDPILKKRSELLEEKKTETPASTEPAKDAKSTQP